MSETEKTHVIKLDSDARIVMVTAKCGPVSPEDIKKVEKILTRMAGRQVRVTAIAPNMAQYYQDT